MLNLESKLEYSTNDDKMQTPREAQDHKVNYIDQESNEFSKSKVQIHLPQRDSEADAAPDVGSDTSGEGGCGDGEGGRGRGEGGRNATDDDDDDMAGTDDGGHRWLPEEAQQNASHREERGIYSCEARQWYEVELEKWGSDRFVAAVGSEPDEFGRSHAIRRQLDPDFVPPPAEPDQRRNAQPYDATKIPQGWDGYDDPWDERYQQPESPRTEQQDEYAHNPPDFAPWLTNAANEAQPSGAPSYAQTDIPPYARSSQQAPVQQLAIRPYFQPGYPPPPVQTHDRPVYFQQSYPPPAQDYSTSHYTQPAYQWPVQQHYTPPAFQPINRHPTRQQGVPLHAEQSYQPPERDHTRAQGYPPSREDPNLRPYQPAQQYQSAQQYPPAQTYQPVPRYLPHQQYLPARANSVNQQHPLDQWHSPQQQYGIQISTEPVQRIVPAPSTPLRRSQRNKQPSASPTRQTTPRYDPNAPHINLLPRPKPTAAYLKQAALAPTNIPRPRPLLVILDLNGTLLRRSTFGGNNTFTSRPHVQEFLQYLLAHHKVLFWSSARPENVKVMVDRLLTTAQRAKLVGVWGRDRFQLSKAQYDTKVQVYKQLSWVWADKDVQATFLPQSEAAIAQQWSQADTVLIDDTVEKALSEPYNLIKITEFEGKKEEMSQDVLGQVVNYLEVLREVRDVSAGMRECPFEYLERLGGADWEEVAKKNK